MSMQHGRNSQRGMTLIEIVVVIVLIGAILAVLSSRLVGSKDRAEYKLAQTQLAGLVQKVEQYQMDVGSYPESLEQLNKAPERVENWLGPYAKPNEFKDPWGMPLGYQVNENGAGFSITSLGADKKLGGESVNHDIRVTP